MESIHLLIDRMRLALQKRTGLTKDRKCREAWEAKGYDPKPEVSLIIQSHNKSLQVEHVVRKLRGRQQTEIIVIDDGSDLSHTRRLARLLTGANEFLLRSNDLYEVTTYDRAVRMASGRYAALLQDDDDFDTTEWIDRAVEFFTRYPAMVILGGNLPLEFVFDREHCHANGRQTEAQRPFDFVPAVNRAPMWLNRELCLRRLGSPDLRFAPFQYDDYELCARAWLQGLSVGCYEARFRSLGAGGMRLWNRRFTAQQCERNGRLLYDLYHTHEEEINRYVTQARTALPNPELS